MTKVKFKTIILFVSSYPSPIGEMFIENELKVLQDKFDKIWIIQTKFLENYNYYRLLKPNNSEKKIIYETKINKAQSIVRFFLSNYFFSEISTILKTFPKKLFNYIIYKDLIYYYLGSEKKKYWLKNFITDNKIDLKTTLFYTYWCDENTFLLYRYHQEIAKIDYVTRLHNWDLYFERQKSKHQPFRNLIFNNSFKVIPISKYGENYCFTKIPNLNKSKFSTSYLGVDNFKCNPQYNTTFNEQKSQILKILTISFITPIKGLENLIHSLEKIKDIDIHWHHIGWGDITYENEIKNQVNQLITNNQNIKVTFHGKFSPNNIRYFLENKRIDLMINCSKKEGIPVTLMEAASAGIPILAYRIDGIPEIVIDKYNGLLVDPNLKDFSAEIQKFYYLKKEDKKRMSENAQTIQRNNFNAVINHNKFIEILSVTEQ